MKRKLLIYLACAGMLAALGGCVRSEMFVMVQDAEKKMAEAEALGADKVAPYEMEAGRKWLAMARHEADEFDMAGMDYAKKSIGFAESAIEKAKGGGK